MKVGELIEELKKHDPELEVVVNGYEGGTSSVTTKRVKEGFVIWDHKRDYAGEHGDLEDHNAPLYDGDYDVPDTKVLMLGRYDL